MGVKHCARGTCTSDSRDKEKEHMRDVKFNSFPKPDLQDNLNENTVKCRNWIKACGRPYSQLNLQKIDQDYQKYKHYYVVCSKHFPNIQISFQFLCLLKYQVKLKKHQVVVKLMFASKNKKTNSCDVQIAKILVNLSQSEPSTFCYDLKLPHTATVSCTMCCHKFTPKTDDLKKLEK